MVAVSRIVVAIQVYSKHTSLQGQNQGQVALQLVVCGMFSIA